MTTHRFGDWPHRKTWVGDLLFEHTGWRGRGRRHRGEHRDGALTVEEIRRSLRTRMLDGDAIYLDTLLHNVKIYGVVSDATPGMYTATLEITPPAALAAIPVLPTPDDEAAA